MLLTLLILGTRSVAQPVSEMSMDAEMSADVIIIGAGMAGVSAARTLVDNNISVIVLEASDRVGGRTYAINTSQGPVDAGAMWIHDSTGPANNALEALALQQNETLTRLQNYFSGVLFNVQNERQSPAVYMQGYGEAAGMRNAIKELQAQAKKDPGNVSDVSIYDMYQRFKVDYNITIEELPIQNLICYSGYELLLNANATNLSSLRYGDAKTVPALDKFVVDGMDSLVKNMVPGIDIRLKSPVVKVVEDSNGVSVTTENGDIFTGKYVISTQSLGCLKAKTIQYDPPLPDIKIEAITQMGMGTFDKAILVYENASFWDNEVDFIQREAPDLGGLWRVFLSYDSIMQKPVLVALNVADTAESLEALTDDEIQNSVMTSLREIYPNLPYPVEFYATRWKKNPYTRGAYSYYAVGNERNITDVIGEPAGKFLFAGEAASSKPGTVLGGHLSGVREAQRVISLMEA